MMQWCALALGLGVLGWLALALLTAGQSQRSGQAKRRHVEEAVQQGLLPSDFERRQRLWEALSWLYLDTEIDLADLAGALHQTGYSHQEILRTLHDEVGPVLAGNLGWGVVPVPGEWAYFEPSWLRSQVLFHLFSRPGPLERRLAGFFSTGLVLPQLCRALGLNPPPNSAPWL